MSDNYNTLTDVYHRMVGALNALKAEGAILDNVYDDVMKRGADVLKARGIDPNARAPNEYRGEYTEAAQNMMSALYVADPFLIQEKVIEEVDKDLPKFWAARTGRAQKTKHQVPKQEEPCIVPRLLQNQASNTSFNSKA